MNPNSGISGQGERRHPQLTNASILERLLALAALATSPGSKATVFMS
jgi:hypothetical protein